MTDRKTLTERYPPGAVRSAIYTLLAVPGKTISDCIHELSTDLYGDDSRRRRQRVYNWLRREQPTPAWARDKCMLIAMPSILERYGLVGATDDLTEDDQILKILDDMR